MIERSALAINLARKDFHSDYTVSAGYYNMGSMPAMYEFRLEIPAAPPYGAKATPRRWASRSIA